MPANGIMAERTETAAVRLRHSDIVPVSPTVSVQAIAEIPDGNHTFPCAGGSRKMPAPDFLHSATDTEKSPGRENEAPDRRFVPRLRQPRLRNETPQNRIAPTIRPKHGSERGPKPQKTVRKTLSDTTIDNGLDKTPHSSPREPSRSYFPKPALGYSGAAKAIPRPAAFRSGGHRCRDAPSGPDAFPARQSRPDRSR